MVYKLPRQNLYFYCFTACLKYFETKQNNGIFVNETYAKHFSYYYDFQKCFVKAIMKTAIKIF